MMKLKHLIELIAELKPNTHLKYIRSDEHCEYIKVDLEEPRVFSKTPDGNEHSITFKKGLNVRGIISLCERVAASGNTSILLSA